MGQISVAIVKRVAFRDSTQHFSNVYTYASIAPNADAYLEGDVIIDAIVAMEKSIHASNTTFVHARMWSSGGPIEENEMLYEKALSGTGASGTGTPAIDRERAILAQWAAGKDTKGRRVYLRKWYHIGGVTPGGYSISAQAVSNETTIATPTREGLAAIIDNIQTVGVLSQWSLVAESGRVRDTIDSPQIHRYLEHRQLGDEWRG